MNRLDLDVKNCEGYTFPTNFHLLGHETVTLTTPAETTLPKPRMIYIFWSCREVIEAKTIIHKLLDQGLIACASIIPNVESIYRWKEKIEESREVKVLLKTTPKHFLAIQTIIQEECSYEVPEILQVDITRGHPRYVAWVLEETTQL